MAEIVFGSLNADYIRAHDFRRAHPQYTDPEYQDYLKLQLEFRLDYCRGEIETEWSLKLLNSVSRDAESAYALLEGTIKFYPSWEDEFKIVLTMDNFGHLEAQGRIRPIGSITTVEFTFSDLDQSHLPMIINGMKEVEDEFS